MRLTNRIKYLENINIHRNRSLSLAEYIQALKDGTYRESPPQPGKISLAEYLEKINAEREKQPKQQIDNRPPVEIQAKAIQTEVETVIEKVDLPVIERKPFSEMKERKARNMGEDARVYVNKLSKQDIIN